MGCRATRAGPPRAAARAGRDSARGDSCGTAGTRSPGRGPGRRTAAAAPACAGQLGLLSPGAPVCHEVLDPGPARQAWSTTDSGELSGPGGGSGGETGLGSTVTAIWIGRPSSLESAWMTSGRSLVSRCSLTNRFGVAISAVFSTRPSGLVSRSHASWLGGRPISASPSRERAQTSARSTSLTDALPSPRRLPEPRRSVASRPQLVVHRIVHKVCTCAAWGFPIPWRQLAAPEAGLRT